MVSDELKITRDQVAHADNIAKARVAHAKTIAANAALQAKKARLGLKEAKLERKAEKTQTNVELAQKGLRRQWLTGRIVPIKQSKVGTRAHTGLRYVNPDKTPVDIEE